MNRSAAIKRHNQKSKPYIPVRLNLGLDEQADFQPIKHDLAKFPWPWFDSSVDEVRCFFAYAKISHQNRGKFMDEIWRILKPDARATVIVPYWTSLRSTMDYDYEWPPFSEASFLCLNRKWREDNKNHPELKCNFEFTSGCSLAPEVQTRSPEVQSEWIKYRTNTILDLHVTLVKKL